MLDSLKAPAWTAQIIRDLKESAFAELTGLVTDAQVPHRENSAYKESRSLLFERYRLWDQTYNGSELDPLLPIDLSGELADVPAVNWTDISADVVLWFSSCPPIGLPPEVVRFGVWFYRTDEPPGFWELYRRQPVTSAAVTAILDELGSVRANIAQQFAATEIGWSWSKNRIASYWKASPLILKSLRQLKEKPAAPKSLPGEINLSPDEPTHIRSTPSNVQMLRFFAGSAARTIYRNLRYFGQEAYWFMAYRRCRERFVSQTEHFHPDGFTAISAPNGHFYADPFVLAHGGRNYLFFEDYPYRERKGVISFLEVDESGPVGKARRVLERPYHLSYPFVFEHEGGIYMIPETFDAGRIELYYASRFPDRWELAAVLRERVNAVDTTLWVENGIFYFFTNIALRGVTPNDFLYLFWADSLTGKWHSHPENPLNSDVRSSRGAGKLFKRHGKLIRPAQDCSVRYGYACQLNEVEVLSPDQYQEAPLSRIEPNWSPGLIGTHTINSNEWIEVIDGQIYKKKFNSRH